MCVCVCVCVSNQFDQCVRSALLAVHLDSKSHVEEEPPVNPKFWMLWSGHQQKLPDRMEAGGG